MKLDRLMGILIILLQNDQVTAPFLAERFEVSRRTINRDIEALCQAGIPVTTRQGTGGGISIAEGYKLDKSILTADELGSLVTALKGLGSVGDRSRIERMLDKLGAGSQAVVSLREPVVIELAPYCKVGLTEKIEALKKAIREQKKVAFDYFYEKGESCRCIEPYTVMFRWTAWYVFGYCTQRRDWRLFKLNRLWNLRLTGESYTSREIPAEKQDFEAFLPDDKKLVARFDPSAKYQLIETYGPACFTVLPDGDLLLETGYTNKEFIVSWLLGFGGKATVLKPKELIEEMQTTARKIWDNYNPT